MSPKKKSKASQRKNPHQSKQATALSMKLWKEWLQWLLEYAGARVYFVIFLTGAFGLRCSEALALKREDFQLSAAIPKLTVTGEDAGARKSPGDVYIRKQHFRLLKEHLEKGIETERSIKHKHGKSKRKQVLKKEKFVVPKTGYIFKSRKGASKPYLHYHAIYDHIVKQAPLFQKHYGLGHDAAKLRPHSSRATVITELMGEGMIPAMSMKYARHAPGSYKVHLRYGRLTLEDVRQACDGLASSRKRTKWSTWSTKDLLKAQKDIQKELAGRMKK